jgi:hypothetical protein
LITYKVDYEIFCCIILNNELLKIVKYLISFREIYNTYEEAFEKKYIFDMEIL